MCIAALPDVSLIHCDCDSNQGRKPFSQPFSQPFSYGVHMSVPSNPAGSTYTLGLLKSNFGAAKLKRLSKQASNTLLRLSDNKHFQHESLLLGCLSPLPSNSIVTIAFQAAAQRQLPSSCTATRTIVSRKYMDHPCEAHTWHNVTDVFSILCGC